MKKLSFFMNAAASLLLAFTATAALQSCSAEDNPAGETASSTVDPTASLIIKEINVGGGFKTTEGKAYAWCKGIVLYNNSSNYATVKNLAIGTIPPSNAHANTVAANYVDGKLVYEDADFVPMIYGVWYNPNTITIAPYSDVVIAINGAIDHTQLAPEAFDLSDASYHAMYDLSGSYVNANAYPTPAAGIPETNYWKAAITGLGNAWAISVSSPNFVLYQYPDDVDPAAWSADEANVWYDQGKETAANKCVKIPTSWVIDAVETFSKKTEANFTKSQKRVPSKFDAGYAIYIDGAGYSAYRNVDQKATEAIAENEGKLVYDYDQAVEGTADASGIDAAASIKKGAKIVYKDTDNSTEDFHLRKTWSLK